MLGRAIAMYSEMLDPAIVIVAVVISRAESRRPASNWCSGYVAQSPLR